MAKRPLVLQSGKLEQLQNEASLELEYLQLNPLASTPVFSEGQIFWNAATKNLAYNTVTNQTIQIGQETVLYVKNPSASSMTLVQVVYINGADTGVPTVALANAASLTTAQVTGVVTQTIAANGHGLICLGGLLTGIDTSAYTAGQKLYLSATTAGGLTNTLAANNFNSRVANVISVGVSGSIYINIQSQVAIEASLPSAIVAAWVNFNGTGTVTIRDSFNIASVADGGTGIYTLNFTRAMPNTNYAIAGSIGRDDSNTRQSGLVRRSGDTKTTSAVLIRTVEERITVFDPLEVYVAIITS